MQNPGVGTWSANFPQFPDVTIFARFPALIFWPRFLTFLGKEKNLGKFPSGTFAKIFIKF